MSLFSGVAKLLNPFTWLHCNKKTEPPPQCEYELQEDDSFPVEEETPSSQLPLESDMENLQGEGDTAHIHIDDEHSDGQHQTGGDKFLVAAAVEGEVGQLSGDTETELNAHQEMDHLKSVQSDDAEKPVFATNSEGSDHTESEALKWESHHNRSIADTSRNDVTFENIPQSATPMVASIEQGSELRVIKPTGEIVEPQPAMEGITLEAVQDQAAMGERNSNYEATMLPTAADSYKNDGARSNDEYYMVSSQTGAEYLEDSVVIIEQPKIIGVFGEPTVCGTKSASKRRARADLHDDSEVFVEFENHSTHQPWRAKHPRRSYNVPSTKNLPAGEYPRSPTTPANTPNSLKTRSRSDKHRSI